MQAVLALALVSVAGAAFIGDRAVFDDGVFFKGTPLWGKGVWGGGQPIHDTTDQMWLDHLVQFHNTHRPEYMMDAGDLGGDYMHDAGLIKNAFYKPSVVFFKGPGGDIVSYYAHDGINNIMPEVKTAFTDLYGAADKVGVHFRPEDILGDYKTVLPGHFFEPTKNFALTRFMHDMPITHDFAPLKFAGKFNHLNKINMNTLPYFYKSPVDLDMTRFLGDASVVPATHGIAGWPMMNGASVMPFGKSIMGSGVTPLINSGLTPAYHLVKADYPFFTAAPTAGLVDAVSPARGIPLFKSAAEPAFTFASGIMPSAGVPLVKAAPCEGCLVGDYAFAPAAGVAGAEMPLFKTAFPATFGAQHAMTYAPLIKTMPYPYATSLFADTAYSPAHSFIPLKF